MPVGKANGFRQRSDIQQYVPGTNNKLRKFSIHFIDEISQRALEPAIQAAKERFHGWSECLKDAERPGISLYAGLNRSKKCDRTPNSRIRCFCVSE